MAMPMLMLEGKDPVAWTGPWPPPETIYVVKGKQTGGVVFTDPEILQSQGITLEEVKERCYVEEFTRTSYSQLPEEVDAHPNVARSAAYKRTRG